MTSRDCATTDSLLGREPQTLTNAERLRLEQHLEHCAACRQHQAASKLVRDAMHEASLELSLPSRERLLAKALASSGETRLSVHPARKTPWKLVVGCALAACLVGGYVAWPALNADPSAAPVAQRSIAEPSAADTLDSAPAPQATETAETWIVSDAVESQQRFAHANVTLAPATRVRFDETSRTLFLGEGRVEVDVDAAVGQSFSVHTQRFRVEVLGTQFSVTQDSVQVRHGKVEVRSHDGTLLSAHVGPGEVFQLEEKAEALAPKPSAKSHASDKPEDAQLSIEKAQKALARGAAAEARSILSRIRQKDLERPLRAEVATLLAEASLLEHEPKAAMSAYETIAKRYADLKAGENAAFAAAQLAGRVAPTRERALLERYLQAYPKGRFTREASARLEKLD